MKIFSQNCCSSGKRTGKWFAMYVFLVRTLQWLERNPSCFLLQRQAERSHLGLIGLALICFQPLYPIGISPSAESWFCRDVATTGSLLVLTSAPEPHSLFQHNFNTPYYRNLHSSYYCHECVWGGGCWMMGVGNGVQAFFLSDTRALKILPNADSLNWSESSCWLKRLPRISLLMSWGGPNIEPRSDH
jgi:hypothetical protein